MLEEQILHCGLVMCQTFDAALWPCHQRMLALLTEYVYLLAAAHPVNSGYQALAEGLLKASLAAPADARSALLDRMAADLNAVPAWIIQFGNTNGEGATAAAGLKELQVSRIVDTIMMTTYQQRQ